MIGKVSCAVPGCAAEHAEEIKTSDQHYAAVYAEVLALGVGWSYRTNLSGDHDTLCPVHKGWRPESEKPTTTVHCECGAVFSREDCSDESASESSHKAMNGTYDAGWLYVDPKHSNIMICPACWAKPHTPPEKAYAEARDREDEDRYADLDAVSRRAVSMAEDKAYTELVEASRSNALWRATVERVCVIIGFGGYCDSTQMFARLRELVAKEAKQ